jgi:hypothetical protein
MNSVFTTLWLFGGQAVAAATVLGLFWAAAARPSRIHKPAAFRLSALLVGASFVANVVIPVGLLLYSDVDDRRDKPRPTAFLLAVPPAILMLAIYIGVDSILERPRPDNRTNAPDQSPE